MIVASTQMTVSSFTRQSYYREKIMIKQSNNSIHLEVKSWILLSS